MINEIMAIAKHKRYNVELTYFADTEEYMLAVYDSNPMVSPNYEMTHTDLDIIFQEIYGSLMAEMVQ